MLNKHWTINEKCNNDRYLVHCKAFDVLQSIFIGCSIIVEIMGNDVIKISFFNNVTRSSISLSSLKFPAIMTFEIARLQVSDVQICKGQ